MSSLLSTAGAPSGGRQTLRLLAICERALVGYGKSRGLRFALELRFEGGDLGPEGSMAACEELFGPLCGALPLLGLDLEACVLHGARGAGHDAVRSGVHVEQADAAFVENELAHL